MFLSWALRDGVLQGFKGSSAPSGLPGLHEASWEFPKIGEPNIVPQIVGSLL